MNTFEDTLTTLIEDPDVAGIRILTHYQSPLMTVTPPAGTLRAAGKDVHGEFEFPDGSQGVTVDSWGSQASRMEAAAEEIADQIGLPVVRFRNNNGEVLTTSTRLSHRHADATWRAARPELDAAGIPFDDIRDATVSDAAPLLRWFPTAILLGWWHSHIQSDKKDTQRLSAFRKDKGIADALAGYARISNASRSARVVTSEITATGIHRRARMAARIDYLFGPLSGGAHEQGEKSSGPSAYGLGSLPPVRETNAPVDVTYDSVEGRWWLSLADLRRFNFADTTTQDAHLLLAALALLLHAIADRQTRLRAGTELVASHAEVEIWRHRGPAEPLELPTVEDLITLVRSLGQRVGWNGPIDVTIPPTSILGRLIDMLSSQQESSEE